ncbi:hypothetical protein [Pseudomonas alabamensis]|uniref:hypothetical protein n=1 Tax=Pseudomonas alabamensis TaxID=3064349 RepID=UPI00119CFAD5
MNTSITPPMTAADHMAIELRKKGQTIAEIRKATGLGERRTKALLKGVEKPKKSMQKTPKILRPFDRAFEKAFTLACRPVGIRDYELRDILHQEYGSSWSTSDGYNKSNYDSDTIKRIRAKVKERASNEEVMAKFLPDWIDETSPKESLEFLLSAALELISRAEEYTSEYMEAHGAKRRESDEELRHARNKQRYATLRMLWKLAVPDYGAEPFTKLLKRSRQVVDELTGNVEELQVVQLPQCKKPDFYPEPSKKDAFLDYAEAQGWV